MAFVDNGRLLVTSFDPNADDPAVTEPVPLLPDDTNIQRVFISPDGRRAAYLRVRQSAMSCMS